MRAASAAALIVVIALSACGPIHPLARFGAATEARTSPSPAPVPSPTPTALLPPETRPPALNGGPCELPVADISEAYGWFVRYPGGARMSAPSSVVALPGNNPGAIGANAGLTFDRISGTWLPVGPTLLAPSGHTYAYQGYPNPTIYAVNVYLHVRIALAPSGFLFGVSNTGAYITGPNGGATFLPFDGGSGVLVAAGRNWLAYHDNAIWGLSGPSGGQLIRRDVTTGTETVLAVLGGWNDLRGFDGAGNPLFMNSQTVPSSDPRQRYNLISVRGDGTRTTIASVPGYEPTGYAVGDPHGVWFVLSSASGTAGGAKSGIYLWTVGRGIQRISAVEGNIAGPCA